MLLWLLLWLPVSQVEYMGQWQKNKGKLVDQVRPDEGDRVMERAMSDDWRQLITGSCRELGCV